jgi:hypothetical protein
MGGSEADRGVTVMRTSEKLSIAWPQLLKMAEKGSVVIYYRGVTEKGIKLYELRSGNSGGIPVIVSEGELLEVLMKEAKENGK